MTGTDATARSGTRMMAFCMAVALVTLVDQATKAAVRELLEVPGASAPFIPHVMDLRLVLNTGAAFSIGEGAGLLFIILAIVVLLVLTQFVWKNPDMPFPLSISMGCVAGGGVGNMIDRIIDGAVTDFFATTFIDFPVFNVADIFVTCGIAVTLILFLRYDSARTQEKP